MPIRDFLRQLSKRFGGIGGTNTQEGDDERSAETLTAATLDTEVTRAEGVEPGADTNGAPADENVAQANASAQRERAERAVVTADARGTVLEETGTASGTSIEQPARNGSNESGGETASTPGETVDQPGETAEAVPEGDEGSERRSNGPVECRIDGCKQTFATAHGMKIHATKVHGEDVKPPHRDPERLQEVYEAHDTFTEMTDALEVEVTPQTVRRSMTALGIHDPENPDGEDSTDDVPGEDSTDDVPGGDSTDDVPGEDSAELEDELGTRASLGGCERVEEALPEGLDGEELIAAIEEARTLYEVQRTLGLDRAETQHLLVELDLLDLVQCRLATKPDPEERRAELERRLGEGIDA